MKFFIPKVKDPDEAERLYQAIRKFVSGSNSRRIFSITFWDRGREVKATVGRTEPCEGLEPVIAILESNVYLVCTNSRGVSKGIPYMVGKPEVSHSEDFDA